MAKDPQRQEAYRLSKLQTLEAWRGSLVDTVLSEELIPAINRRIPPDLTSSLNIARGIFDKQLESGLEHQLREPGIKPSMVSAAFHKLEYKGEITADDVEIAWTDVEASLSNFFKMEGLIEELRRANYLVPQRPLQFKHFPGVSVKAVPDLIAFFRNAPPLIVDWKVNTGGTKDHRLQLATYAVALARLPRIHADFPDYLLKYEPTDYRLVEVQLLTNQQKQYSLSAKDVDRVESYISSTATRMNLAMWGESTLSPSDFPVTNYPDACQTCPFIALCEDL